MVFKKFVFMFFSISIGFSKALNPNNFPEGFLFGVSTSAYQIEGAWNESSKGENIWDRLTHSNPEHISDMSNADLSCDSYNKIREDVALLKHLGVHFYRFSLSWSRILPSGFVDSINPDGIRYYNELIDELLAAGIEPMVTLYHWDLPQSLQDLGGWPNPQMALYFKNYAKIVFQNFGDRVKLWLTFNEPKNMCVGGYDGTYAPVVYSDGIGTYLCAHTVIQAHAAVYHLYDNKYRKNQKGKIGITLGSRWYHAASENLKDIAARERALQFELGFFAHPIFSRTGDYPQLVKYRVGTRSKNEGFVRSRLPEFTEEEVKYIRGTFDYFGLNHYTTFIAADTSEEPIGEPGYKADICASFSQDGNWSAANNEWLKVVPWGFQRILKWIKESYDDPDVYVTENGYCDEGKMDDKARIDYHKEYLSSLLDVIYDDEVKVKGYAVWSLLDNFEWTDGFKPKFGLYHVDFNSNDRTRRPKSSAQFYKETIATRKIPSSSSTFLKNCTLLGALLIFVSVF